MRPNETNSRSTYDQCSTKKPCITKNFISFSFPRLSQQPNKKLTQKKNVKYINGAFCERESVLPVEEGICLRFEDAYENQNAAFQTGDYFSFTLTMLCLCREE